MKKELKEILESNNTAALESYIKSDKSLDYAFSNKYGDDTLSMNVLLYCIVNNKDELAKVIFKNANNLFVKDCINRNSSTLQDMVVNKCIDNTDLQGLIYNAMDGGLREKTAKTITSRLNNPYGHYKDMKYENYEKFLRPEDKVGILIKEDNANALVEFIDKNPNFFKDSKQNYLMKSIESQAVFCFDILKDHLKTLKLQQNPQETKKSKPF